MRKDTKQIDKQGHREGGNLVWNDRNEWPTVAHSQASKGLGLECGNVASYENS